MVALVNILLVTAFVVFPSSVRSQEEEKTTPKPSKLFLYGRKFELPNDSKAEKTKDKLYSPLITAPIRTLPMNTTDVETLKHNQNEIFTNIQDLFKETAKETFNKTYFGEEATEEENHGGESTTQSSSQNEETSAEVNSRSRQDADRSLLVVLPFKADEGGNVEELFTKSPLVRVIEDDETGTVTTEREVETTPKRRKWRPFKRYTTPPTETTTEDVTKTYTNYNDVEQVTQKFENPKLEINPTLDFTTPYPVYKQTEIKKDQEEEEVTTTTTEKPKLKLKRKGQRRKSTTEGPPKPEELSKVLEILPQDMKDLIMEIGLNKENKQESASETNFRLERPPQPTIDPLSYSVFKPLPIEGQENRNFVSDDMREFLASFGLLPVGKRVQKSLKPEVAKNKTVDVNLDFLPDDLKTLLEDMGLVKGSDKKEPTRIHIFNPSNHSIAHSEEDFEKLNAILSSIKTTVNESQSLTPEMQSEVIEKIRGLNMLRYKNGNLSEINNEIKKIVVSNKTGGESKSKSTAKRATKLIEGPDPLMFSEESLLKNEVKRQGDGTSASASSSASSSSSTSGTSSASSSASSSAGADSTSFASSSATGDSSSSASSSASSDSSASSSASASSDSEAATTTEEPANIEALKESFGGGETASDDADIESSLPPKRPNGLYLLLDWNSFLEVGTDDDSRRVNLRFQPKIGDSRNFLPVSVP